MAHQHQILYECFIKNNRSFDFEQAACHNLIHLKKKKKVLSVVLEF